MARNTSQPAPAPETLLQEAHALFAAEKYAPAAALYQQALQTCADDFLIWGNLGISLRHLKKSAASAACMRRADELRPKNAAILRHYGLSLTSLDRKDEALAAFAESLRLQPKDFNTHLYYAAALHEFGLNDDALRHIDKACALDASSADARWLRADILLQMGNFKEGWKDFEIRWKLGNKFPFLAAAAREKGYTSQRWTGEDLAGKTVLVYEEQGYGDTILCSRFIPVMKTKAARVIFRGRAGLHRLFSAIPGIDRIVAQGDELGETVDYHVPVMSLPAIFGTTLENLPPPPPLHAPPLPPGAVEKLALTANVLNVGIVWSGSVTYSANEKRALPCQRFLPLAEVPGVRLFSLQKGPPEKELVDAGAEGAVTPLAPLLQDFADTAAVLRHLDLVIMTDSSVAHLAGSVGCPVWNLLPYNPYWIYFTRRSDSPWYPSMRLFRQKEPGAWAGVLDDVTAALRQAAADKKAGRWPWPPE